MNVRYLYLKIATVPNYSPVAPDNAEHHKHRLDCTRNMAHIDATIPQVEVNRRSLDALIFCEYLDTACAVIKNTPLIAMAAFRTWRGRVPGSCDQDSRWKTLFTGIPKLRRMAISHRQGIYMLLLINT